MKDGIIFLAAKSGRPIVPMAFRCTSTWRIPGKWTDLVIPKPFSKVTICLETPIEIPRKVSREELLHYTEQLQQVMDEVYARTEDGRILHREHLANEQVRDAA